MTDTPRKKDSDTRKPVTDSGPEEHERVPEEAENIEHTLRRLIVEKEKRREKDPGLYY